jgi:hypothetical protein
MTLEISEEQWTELRRDVKDTNEVVKVLRDKVGDQNGRLDHLESKALVREATDAERYRWEEKQWSALKWALPLTIGAAAATISLIQLVLN